MGILLKKRKFKEKSPNTVETLETFPKQMVLSQIEDFEGVVGIILED